jgi:hypothetical protein
MHGIAGEYYQDEDEWVEPGVSERDLFPSAEGGAGFSSLGMRFVELFEGLLQS